MNPEGPLAKNGECYSMVFGNSTTPPSNLEKQESIMGSGTIDRGFYTSSTLKWNFRAS